MVVAVNSGPAREGGTRERLLNVATEMFAERGYAATGVDALCRGAGVAKTGLYWEFQNKVGLLMAVIDRVVSEWTDAVRQAVTDVEPERRLDRALSALRHQVRERPETFRLILVVLAERSLVDDEARDALRRFFETARDALVCHVREIAPRPLPSSEVVAFADLALARVEGVFLRIQVYGNDSELDAPFDAMRSAITLLVSTMVRTSGNVSPGLIFDIAKPTG
jgi:AcrR family transcriptional regulator